MKFSSENAACALGLSLCGPLTQPNPTESTQAHRRLLLTGTPLQNDLRELWALLNLLLPEVGGFGYRMPGRCKIITLLPEIPFSVVHQLLGLFKASCTTLSPPTNSCKLLLNRHQPPPNRQVFDNQSVFAEWFAEFVGNQPIAPDKRGSEAAWFQNEKRMLVITRLHQILEPFMLRRMVGDGFVFGVGS